MLDVQPRCPSLPRHAVSYEACLQLPCCCVAVRHCNSATNFEIDAVRQVLFARSCEHQQTADSHALTLLRGQSCFSASLLPLSRHVHFLQATGSTCQVGWEVHCHYGMAAHPTAADVLAFQVAAMLLVMVQRRPWDLEGSAASPSRWHCRLLLVSCC